MGKRASLSGPHAPSVGDALSRATTLLSAAGCDTPRLDAEVLLGWVLGLTRPQLVLEARERVGPASAARFEVAIERRAAREPVAYIVGSKDFRRLSLAVDRRVLIPRPETELLVEVGLELPTGTAVVDVGTGSGAVALALKDERPDLAVIGSDRDPGAIALARANAARLGLDVRFVCADLLSGVPDGYEAVLANLPYVAESSRELAADVSLYEPPAALFAGPDGLDAIRRLVAMAAQVPLVALEVGFDQADAVERLLRAYEVGSVERLRDLAGHDRVLVRRR